MNYSKTITWAIINPITVKTSKFNTALKNELFRNNITGKHSYYSHFGNRQQAEESIVRLQNLGTTFSVQYITDEDFGKIKIYYFKK